MRGVSVAPVMRRLLALSEPGRGDSCWEWRGVIKKNGYGTLAVKINGRWRTQHAHRVSYEHFIGTIPAGMDLDHLCRNRACVNPNHLEPVTRSANLGRSPLMSRQGAKTHCPKGHPYSGANSRGQRICHTCLAAATRKYRNGR